MKKIMFNDKYGLTQAVLDGRKTQTRRIIKMPYYDEEYLDTAFDWDFRESVIIDRYAKFKVEETVAVAQSYKDLGYSETALDRSPKDWRIVRGTLGQSKGWNNKMFVRVDACKEKGHQICITNVRIERLQDISDEDCMAEGIYPYYYGDEEEKKRYGIPPDGYSFDGWDFHYPTPREAYAALIDKVGKKGDWESNPYVFVYDFELLK